MIKDDEEANYICLLHVLSGTVADGETKNENNFCDLYYMKICTIDVPREECGQKLVTCTCTTT